MTRNKWFYFVFFLIGTINYAIAQKQEIAKYVILTFEDTYKKSPHGLQTYYWIVAQDSLTSGDYVLGHLFLSNFSKDNLIDCCNGAPIDPFIADQHTNYDFDTTYFNAINGLKKIIATKRKKLLTISKTWQSGQKEEIVVFATPVEGKFCSSTFHSIGQSRTGYKGKVYIPFSSFKYSDGFWETPEAKLVLNKDFSKTNFDIIPY